MTREEAIFCEKSYIGETNCTDCKYYGMDTCISRESHKMAIKALEQEPCEDCISRQATIELIKNYCENGCDIVEDNWCPSCQREQFIELLKAMPSVIPKGVTVTDFADKCRECGREKVFDKIRAEIIENSIEDYKYHGCGSDELIIETSEVLKIIDKHKTESEDKG